MKDLYAPWRSFYAQSLNISKEDTECVFCSQPAQNTDAKNFILKRYAHWMVLLNKYPYNAGHLLVVPFEHKKALDEFGKNERHEMIEIVNTSIEILQHLLKPEGINVGLNLGSAAGAGIPNHLHMHILPRWNGDTNFLPTLADTKVISFDLKDMYEQLKPSFDKHSLKLF